ncbi:unnamed protein product [Trifolium pratense]|uniref:Uncharacterized protein n=1 Tax=Trifolium pratense TaxID=57577 RepID=A0ACB0K987_TRIPR|nr:unnamed protein product [Trifolium pratense]
MGPARGKASQSIRGRVIATMKIRSDYLISLQRASSNGLPIGGEISVDCENDMFRNTPKTSMEEALDKQLKIGNSATSVGTNQRKGCYYTSIPHVVTQGAVACCFLLICAHVFCWTSYTQLLETLLEKNYGGSEDLLLGELQFAFIAFLVWLRIHYDILQCCRWLSG